MVENAFESDQYFVFAHLKPYQLLSISSSGISNVTMESLVSLQNHYRGSCFIQLAER